MRGLCGFATTLLVLLSGCSSARPRPPSQAAPLHAVATQPAPAPTLQVAAPGPSEAELGDARHLLSRLAFGPRPGEVERVARLGSARWLNEQLALPEESPLLTAALAAHAQAFEPPGQLIDEWLGEDWDTHTRTSRELREETKPHFREHLARLATAELTRDILSQRQLEAVMTDFFANHFNVYASKGLLRLFLGDYLERAIRPHALGKFYDLLLATARHPAMLLYLDNAESRRERGSPNAPRRRRGGLNENYARELLELHTLGVDAGYTQADVQNVARILTGWSVVRVNEGGFDYVFRRLAHDRGEKVVLGETFPAGQDEAEGVRLLQLLARHPATARHLAQRLCARFVADVPPESCVRAGAAAYTRSDGDLRQVVRAIVDDASFWAADARGNKLKTPLELVASAARALGARPDGSLSLATTLGELGEPLLQERAPTGYPDAAAEWASGGGMLARLSFAGQLGQDHARGLLVPWDETFPRGEQPLAAVTRLGASLLGLSPKSRTLTLVREKLGGVDEPEQARAVAVALLIGSPEFQRQ